MKKVLIVEDEFSIALDLEVYLEELGYEVIGIADHYEQAIEMMETEKPHIVLMDIHLKGAKTGIEAARVAYQTYRIPVIFLSALTDSITFSDAMETEPFGYLTKPFKEIDLRNTLSIASHQYELLQIRGGAIDDLKDNVEIELTYEETFFVKDKNKLIAIKVSDILWVEALENYSIIVLNDQKVMANFLLKDIFEKLPKNHFSRVHRSYVIAIDKIKKLEDGYIYITNVPIPLSKGHREELLQRIKIV
jgi:DNA-binding LytR/AlgR family response regulator